MSDLTCPECSTESPLPPPGTKKITCSGCGMILVMRKVLGEDWERHLEAAQKAPVIKKRRPSRTSSAKESGSSRGRSRPSRAPREEAHEHPPAGGGRRRRSTTRRAASGGMSPAMVFGSIGGFIVVAALVFFLWQNQQEEKEKKEAEERAAAEAKAEEHRRAQAELLAGDEEVDPAAEPGDETAATAAGDDGGEKPAAANDAASKKMKKPASKKGKEGAPFEVPAGTDAALVKTMEGHIDTLTDLNATRTAAIAGDKLREHPKVAIPLLINRLFKFDLDDKDDTMRGWQVVQVLQSCAQRKEYYDNMYRVFEWPTDEEELKTGRLGRKTSRNTWWRWWDKNEATWKPESEEDF